VPDLLKTIIRHYVVYFSQNRLAQQVAEREMRELSPEHYEIVRSRQREYLGGMIELVQRGIDREQLIVADATITTRAFLDMLNYFNRWFEPRRRLGLATMADLYADLIVDHLLGGNEAKLHAGTAQITT
jgi:hypothetical protein